jgi:hypothetical protein
MMKQMMLEELRTLQLLNDCRVRKTFHALPCAHRLHHKGVIWSASRWIRTEKQGWSELDVAVACWNRDESAIEGVEGGRQEEDEDAWLGYNMSPMLLQRRRSPGLNWRSKDWHDENGHNGQMNKRIETSLPSQMVSLS